MPARFTLIALLLHFCFHQEPAGAATPQTLQLLYTNESGDLFPITQYRSDQRITSIGYYDKAKRLNWLNSLVGVRVSGPAELLDSYAELFENYQLSYAKSSRDSSIIIKSIEPPRSYLDISQENAGTLYAIVWIQADKVTLVYLNYDLSDLSSISLPLALGKERGAPISGYPAILTFKGGTAAIPFQRAMTPQRVASLRGKERGLELAVLNEIPETLIDLLSTHRKDKKLDFDLVNLAATNGRAFALEELMKLGAEIGFEHSGMKRKLKEMRSKLGPLLFKTAWGTMPKDPEDFDSYRVLWSTLYEEQSSSFERLLEFSRFKDEHLLASSLVARSISQNKLNYAQQLLDAGYELRSNKKLDPILSTVLILHNRTDLLESHIKPKASLIRSLSFEDNKTLFHKVAPFANIETLEYLKGFSLPSDLEDDRQYTPLIVAAGYGNISAVCWFLEQGARIDHRNHKGHTALQYSIIKQQAEATACLLDEGSDINLLGPKGVTPLMQAALFRDNEGAESIATAGGIWNLDSSYLDSCIEYSLQQDLSKSIDIALQQGLSRKHKAFGRWPIHWLASYYQAEQCRHVLASEFEFDQLKSIDRQELRLRLSDSAEILFSANSRDLTGSEFTFVIDRNGECHLPFRVLAINRYIETQIAKLIKQLKFEGPTIEALPHHFLLKARGKITRPRKGNSLAEAFEIIELDLIPVPGS